jgi:hypothetical protein
VEESHDKKELDTESKIKAEIAITSIPLHFIILNFRQGLEFRHTFRRKHFFRQSFLRVPHIFFSIDVCKPGSWNWPRPYWPWTILRPQNFVFSQGYKIRRPSPNFVTLESYIVCIAMILRRGW